MEKNNKWLDAEMKTSLVGVLLGLVFTPTAYAVDALGTFVEWGPWLLVFGFFGLFVGAVFYYVKIEKLSLPAFVVGGLLLAAGFAGVIAGFIIQPSGGGGGGGGGTTYVAQWECNFRTLAAGGPGGAHDAITEFPDAPFIAADGGTPDLNKVIATPVIDFQQKSAVVDVSVDDDITNTAAGWLDEDAYAFDIDCRLTNPLPAVGGGSQEIPIWGRISTTRTAGTQNNGSAANVYYCDITAGYYLGFGAIADSGAAADGHDADHSYFSYTNQNSCPAAGPLVGTWIPLGTSDGDPDGEWIAVWYVLDVGLSDYTSPAIGTGVGITVELGTDPTNAQHRGNIVTLSVDNRILART